jgi:glycerate kinase
VADGGEGTVETLLAAMGGEKIAFEVAGPLGERREATFGILADGKTAVMEMAEASGLRLVPRDRLDPGAATTRGTGDLIRAALDRGASRIILGIGGSATNDGGLGMAQVLGIDFLDAEGRPIGRGRGAGAGTAGLDRRGRARPKAGRRRTDRRL